MVKKPTKKDKKTKKEKEKWFQLAVENFACPKCRRMTIKQEITNNDYRCTHCDFFITKRALKRIIKEKDKEVEI